MLLYTCDTVLIYFIAQADGERLPIQLGVKIISFFPIFVGKGGGHGNGSSCPNFLYSIKTVSSVLLNFFSSRRRESPKAVFFGRPSAVCMATPVAGGWARAVISWKPNITQYYPLPKDH